MTTMNVIVIILGIVFFTSPVILLVCGLAIDFWLTESHKKRTGFPLITPTLSLPCITGVACGMELLMPKIAKRIHKSSIRLATPGWQWIARLSAISMWGGLLSMIILALMTKYD